MKFTNHAGGGTSPYQPNAVLGDLVIWVLKQAGPYPSIALSINTFL